MGLRGGQTVLDLSPSSTHKLSLSLGSTLTSVSSFMKRKSRTHTLPLWCYRNEIAYVPGPEKATIDVPLSS